MSRTDLSTLFEEPLTKGADSIAKLTSLLPVAAGDADAVEIIHDMLHVHHLLQSVLHGAQATLTRATTPVPTDATAPAHHPR